MAHRNCPVLMRHLRIWLTHAFMQTTNWKQGTQHWLCHYVPTSGPNSFVCFDGNPPISLDEFPFIKLLAAYGYTSIMVTFNTMPPPPPRILSEDDGILAVWTA